HLPLHGWGSRWSRSFREPPTLGEDRAAGRRERWDRTLWPSLRVWGRGPLDPERHRAWRRVAARAGGALARARANCCDHRPRRVLACVLLESVAGAAGSCFPLLWVPAASNRAENAWPKDTDRLEPWPSHAR